MSKTIILFWTLPTAKDMEKYNVCISLQYAVVQNVNIWLCPTE